MRFMVQVKATKESESGALPDPKLFEAMGAFNQELIDAGVMLAGDGLQASSKGARILFSGDQRTVVKGPFPDPESLVAGFWVWRLSSLTEAIEWAKRCPNPHPGDSVLEIRQMFEPEDFAEILTPELAQQEKRQREKLR